MTEIMAREHMHKLLDAVLDIVEVGEDSVKYPHVELSVSNNPVCISLRTKRGDQTGYDLFEHIFECNRYPSPYMRWMRYLTELKNE